MYEEKSNFISTKVGYVAAEFINMNELSSEDKPAYKYDYEHKKTIYLSPLDIGIILALPSINPSLICNKSILNPDMKKVVKIEKVDDNHDFTLMELKKDVMTNSITVSVKPNELIVIQELLKYALPYIMGWSYLSNPDAVEKDLNNDSGTNSPPSPFKNPHNT